MERDTLPPAGPRHARPEPTLDEVRWQFRQWECWKGISGLYYARPLGDVRSAVQAETPLVLHDGIIRWIRRHQDEN